MKQHSVEQTVFGVKPNERVTLLLKFCFWSGGGGGELSTLK